jgi:flagellar basal body P-ring formation protein FlgA
MNRFILALAVVTLLAGWSCLTADEDASLVRIYLPQEVHVQVTQLDIASMGIVRCSDEALARKASSVAMGRAPWPRETMTIDRQSILSRLASAGIDTNKVKITGAEKVAVLRDERIFASDELLKAAERFLQETRPGPEGCMWRLAKPVRELAVPKSRDLHLTARLMKDSTDAVVKLEVVALAGQIEAGKVEATFRVVFAAQQAVASKDIAAGATLTKDNVRLEAVSAEARPAENWIPPYGMVATRSVTAGTVLKAGTFTAPRPEVLVKRGQVVTMRVGGEGFTITAVGEAMEDGHGGDVIKVRNSDTKRVVIAKVAFDGSVEPCGVLGDRK